MALELCTPEDVAEQVLQLPTTPDAPWGEFAIEAATEWAKGYLQAPWLDADAGVEWVTSGTDVSWEGFVRAPAPVTKVEVIGASGGTPEEIGAEAWTYDEDGVRLRPFDPYAWGPDPRYNSPFAQEEGFPRYYVRVDVTTKITGDVDPRVRLGVALAAGAIVTRTPRLARGLQSEHIGDYSYAIISPKFNNDPFFEQAKTILRPVRSAGPVAVP